MPALYRIDKDPRLVLSTGWGVFTLADAVSHQGKLAKDRDFHPSFSQIADFTQVTQFDVTADDILEEALDWVFPKSATA